jgi:integrase
MRVKVESFKGWLRLRWSYEGQRLTLSLGLPDSVVNRTAAIAKAATIEGDLATGNFDSSLAKYRPAKRVAEPSVGVLDLLERFIELKSRKVEKGTLSKLKALREPVSEFFGSKSAIAVDDDLADRFRVYLIQDRGLSPATVKDRLGGLSACWKWATKQGMVTGNPWVEPLKLVKVPPAQKPKPFTSNEIAAILEAFRSSKYYAHYADFVEFRFGCGCRIEEAIGLQWKHLSEDCSTVWIGEAVTRGKVRKTTKTNRSREFKLSPRLQRILLARRPADWQPDGIVFPGPKGGILNDSNFGSRAWRSVLHQLKIPYRKFNSARHTFTSHALARGVKPMTVAEIAGHDPEVLFKHYASEIDGGLQLPDIL